MAWIKIGNLKGANGDCGADGMPGESIVGPAGPRGDPGRNGFDGRDGRGIVSGGVEDGTLVLTLSDGQTLLLGRVVGDKGDRGDRGEAGIGVDALAINASGELVANFSDGRDETIGLVRGPAGLQGVKGDRGPIGQTGPAGESITGERGPIGPRGEIGPAGIDATPGTIVELGESRPANLAAGDIGRLRLRELVIDGESVGHVVAWD